MNDHGSTDQERFNERVMNWISDATSVWADACRSDGGRKIMRDACMTCWDAYNKQSVLSTPSGGQPPGRSGENERRDYTHPDTKGLAQGGPAHHTPSEAEIDALEFVVVNGRIGSLYDYGILRSLLVRLRPEFDRPQPIERTPETQATPAQGTVPPEWTSKPFYVDPPSGHRYGFPRLYDPAKDGDMTEWMIRHGYPEQLARKNLHCTFTASE